MSVNEVKGQETIPSKYTIDHGGHMAIIENCAEAKRNFEKYLLTHPTEDDLILAWALYSIACIYALEGRTKEAISFLGQSLEKGLRDLKHIRADKDLDLVRSDPKFVKLIEKYFPDAK